MGRGGSASSSPEKGTAAVIFFISTRPILVDIGLLTTAQRTNGVDSISVDKYHIRTQSCRVKLLHPVFQF